MSPFLSRLFLLIFVSQTIFNTSAQKNDTVFYSQYNDVTRKDRAMYYLLRDSVTYENGLKKWDEKKYFITHELAQFCQVIETEDYGSPEIVQNGISKVYYKSGKLKGFYNIIMGEPNGSYEKYYEDGKLMETGKLDGWDRTYVYHFYNQNGFDALNNGSGTFKYHNESLNSEAYYFIKDSLLKFSFSIDEDYKDTIYLNAGSHLSFGKGHDKLMRKLSKLRIPINLIEKYSGSSFRYRLVVMEDGTVDRIKSLESVDAVMDQLIFDTIKKYGVFKPPVLNNGRRVKIYVQIPIRLFYAG